MPLSSFRRIEYFFIDLILSWPQISMHVSIENSLRMIQMLILGLLDIIMTHSLTFVLKLFSLTSSWYKFGSRLVKFLLNIRITIIFIWRFLFQTFLFHQSFQIWFSHLFLFLQLFKTFLDSLLLTVSQRISVFMIFIRNGRAHLRSTMTG